MFNPLMLNGAFNICCPRDCVSRHNGGASGAPLKPLRVDSALKALSTLGGLRGAPEVPPLCRETQSLGQQMLKEPLGINGLRRCSISKDRTRKFGWFSNSSVELKYNLHGENLSSNLKSKFVKKSVKLEESQWLV